MREMQTTVGRFSARLLERRIKKEPDHWLWTGYIDKESGYGKFCSMPAHRLVYELYVGPIPEGHEVCHLCTVKHCVWPEHLTVGTHAENQAMITEFGRTKRLR